MNTQRLQANTVHVNLPFLDRSAAGIALAAELYPWRERPDVVVLGLPRGGVPVATSVAHELGVPLDYLLVHKVCLPGHAIPIGAVAEGDVEVWNAQVLRGLLPSNPIVSKSVLKARDELRRRKHFYHGDGERQSLEGRTVIVVDDGLETGSSVRAAIKAVRAQGAAAVIVAVPAAPRDTVATLSEECDEIVCLVMPEPFHDIDQFYLNDAPIGDQLPR